MTDFSKKLVTDYMIKGLNIGEADVFDAIDTFISMDGKEIIELLRDNQSILRPIITKEIPVFSNENDVYHVLRVLVDSGIDSLTYEKIGTYLCPVDAKKDARRKYGETHYKFASQLGLAANSDDLAATEIGVAFYLMANSIERQELMNRLVFSIPIVQQAILKATYGQFYMPDFLEEYLSKSSAIRRRSNMKKIMNWAQAITTGEDRKIFDNIGWY